MNEPLDVARKLHSLEGTGARWGICIEDVRHGYARVSMKLRSDMLNGHGTAHGGMIFALADTAFAYACNTRNEKTVGAQASIIYLDAAFEGETLVAEAVERALVRKVGAYAVSVLTSDGRRIADFQGYSRLVRGPSVPD